MHVPRLLAVVAAAAFLSAPALADTLTLTLLNPNQSIPAGQTAQFNATATASASNTAAIFLNGDSFSVSGPFTLDDSAFFNNFPVSLAPGMSFTGALFTLTDTASSGTSAYNGFFAILGGPNSNTFVPLATVAFPSVVSATTPEPSSLALLLTGTGALGIFTRRLRQKIG